MRTFSRSPTSRASTFFPLNMKHDDRAGTRSPGIWASALMISSVIPSLKYSFSGSALRLTKGSTAIEASAVGWLPGMNAAAQPKPCPAASVSAEESPAAVANRSAGARASARAMIASTTSGISGLSVRSAGALSVSRWTSIALAVRPWNGGTPASASNSTQPRL